MKLKKIFEELKKLQDSELGNIANYPTKNSVYIEVFTSKDSVAEKVLDKLIELLQKHSENEDYKKWHCGMKKYNNYWKDESEVLDAYGNCFVVFAKLEE